MELPAAVIIHNELLGMKGKEGRLVALHATGYYELIINFGESDHRVLMPIEATVLIAAEAEHEWESGVELEP